MKDTQRTTPYGIGVLPWFSQRGPESILPYETGLHLLCCPSWAHVTRSYAYMSSTVHINKLTTTYVLRFFCIIMLDKMTAVTVAVLTFATLYISSTGMVTAPASVSLLLQKARQLIVLFQELQDRRFQLHGPRNLVLTNTLVLLRWDILSFSCCGEAYLSYLVWTNFNSSFSSKHHTIPHSEVCTCTVDSCCWITILEYYSTTRDNQDDGNLRGWGSSRYQYSVSPFFSRPSFYFLLDTIVTG